MRNNYIKQVTDIIIAWEKPIKSKIFFCYQVFVKRNIIYELVDQIPNYNCQLNLNKIM